MCFNGKEKIKGTEIENKNLAIIIIVLVIIALALLFYGLIVLHTIINNKDYVIIFQKYPIPVIKKKYVNFLGFRITQMIMIEICIGMIFASFCILLSIIFYLLFFK